MIARLDFLSASWHRYIIYIFVLFTIAAGWGGAFILDDAYITLHNARSLLSGYDPTYGVSSVVGATSPVHLLLVAVAGLALPLPTASALLALASAILYLYMLDLALRRQGASGWQLTTLVVVGALVGSVPLHMANGLETSLAMAVVAAIIAYADDERILPVISGIAPFIRPELGVFSAILLLNMVWGKGWPMALSIAGRTAASAAPFLIWIFLSTGSVLPSTASAKIAYMADNGGSIRSLLRSLIISAILLGGGWPLLLCLRGARSRIGILSILFFTVFITVSFLYAPRSITWNYHRYLAIFVPVALAMVPHIKPARTFNIYVIVIAACSAIQIPYYFSVLEKERNVYEATLVSVSKLANSLPANSRVLIHDAGIIAWYGQHLKITDIVGLKSPENIQIHKDYTKKECEWTTSVDRIAQNSQANYVIILEDHIWRCIKGNLRDAGWSLEPMESFGGRYQLYRLSKMSDGAS